MIYIQMFLIIFGVFMLINIASKVSKSKKLKDFFHNYDSLFIVMLIIMVIMAIITKDPITVWGVTIPMEFQWLGIIFIAGFTSWRYYLNPLKGKVYELDREMGEVKSDISSIKEDMRMVKDKILNGKVKSSA